MANDTLTTMQYSLARAESRLVDLTQKCWKEPLGAFLKDGNKITTLKGGGRALTRYFNDQLYPAGGFGQVPSGGDYHLSRPESETQASIAMQLFAMTVSYTEHGLKALELGGREMVLQDLDTKLRNAVDHTQRRMSRQLMSRGDGVVARASGTHTATTTVTSSIPLRLVIGDYVYAKTADSNNERGLGGTTECSGTRVTSVNYSAGTFLTEDAVTCTDDAVFYIVNAATNYAGAGVYIHGLEMMLDNTTDNWQWDDDDSDTYDHRTAYLGLTAASVAQANCQEYNASSSSPDINMFGAMYDIAGSYGADPSKLVLILNPASWRAYSETYLGNVPRKVKLDLPGGTYSVPVIDGVGQDSIPVIVDWGIATSKMAMLDTSKFYKLTAPGGWNKRTGNLWQRNAAETAGNPGASAYSAFFDIWMQVALNLPYTSVVAYGVTTA